MNEIGKYSFGVCRIDVPAREIRRDNELISTEPKAFDLLIYLIRNRHRAVGKDKLQDEIRRGTIVTEAALTSMSKPPNEAELMLAAALARLDPDI